jgi:hypothetical protein
MDTGLNTSPNSDSEFNLSLDSLTLFQAEHNATLTHPLPSTNGKGATLDDFVRFLLHKSTNIPCTVIASIFSEIVPPEKKFGVSLDVVLPAFSSSGENTIKSNVRHLLIDLDVIMLICATGRDEDRSCIYTLQSLYSTSHRYQPL